MKREGWWNREFEWGLKNIVESHYICSRIREIVDVEIGDFGGEMMCGGGVWVLV